eukprot:TRINITY_DN8971_c0_g3_i1.p1 TRINITY_DN8971_c0_g3~~TRINITY_DN8971_c0_g3_i1.p1  ORF type:complete len:800 (+),score=82.12 TRINITY_DN8971_c0_g3_i1:56-2401(+)
MAETSLSNLLRNRFQSISQQINAQHELLHAEVIAWQEKFIAECQRKAERQSKTDSAEHALNEVRSPTQESLSKIISGRRDPHLDIEFVDVDPLDEIQAKPTNESTFLDVLPGSLEPFAHHKPILKDNLLRATPDEYHSIPNSPGSNRITRELSKQSSLGGSPAGRSFTKQLSRQFSQEGAVIQHRRPSVIKFRNRNDSMGSMNQVPQIQMRPSYISMDGVALSFTPHDCFSGTRAHSSGLAGLRKGATADVDRILSKVYEDSSEQIHELTWQEWLVVQPGSARAIAWESIGIIIVAFDWVVQPLQLLSDENLLGGADEVVTYLMRFYWTLDIGIGFITGYFAPKDGKLELSIKKIAWRYATTMLAFDGALVLVDWATFTVDKAGRTQRVVRFLRLFRLLRLVRLGLAAQKVLVIIQSRVLSDNMLIAIELVKVIVYCLVWIHPIACGFYAAGRLENSGWVHFYSVDDGTLWSRYITASHWSMSQLTGDSGLMPQTSVERTYATVVLIKAFVLAALIISNLTTLMTQLQLMVAEKKRQVICLQMYLSDNNVSARLATRVVDYVTRGIEEQRRTPSEDMVDLLLELSTPLQTELHYDINSKFLIEHLFFRGYDRANQRGMRAVCHTAAIKCKTAHGDVLFSSGEAVEHPQMYMLLKGQLEYSYNQSEILQPGRYVNEAVLWTPWPQQLGTLRSLGEGQVLCIQAIPFRHACDHFQTGTFYPARYAKLFVQEMNKVNVDDILETFDFIDAHALFVSVFGHLFTEDEISAFAPRQRPLSTLSPIH